MTAKALITWGGWEGHEPEKVATLFRNMLESEGVAVTLTDSLACFDEAEALRDLDLIVPVWTMSELSRQAAINVSEAVSRGTGLAGCHGGMCDAFRSNDSFEVSSEQYYLHVDPANHVLATTRFPTVTWYHSPNGPVEMPVAWTRRWGMGRVYYNALGHKADVIASGAPYEMLRRGLLWAAKGRAAAEAAGERHADFVSEGSHF